MVSSNDWIIPCIAKGSSIEVSFMCGVMVVVIQEGGLEASTRSYVQTGGLWALCGEDLPQWAAVTGMVSPAEWLWLWGIVFDTPLFLEKPIIWVQPEFNSKPLGYTGVHHASLSFQEYLFFSLALICCWSLLAYSSLCIWRSKNAVYMTGLLKVKRG